MVGTALGQDDAFVAGSVRISMAPNSRAKPL
jgi:hypothetical protein